MNNILDIDFENFEKLYEKRLRGDIVECIDENKEHENSAELCYENEEEYDEYLHMCAGLHEKLNKYIHRYKRIDYINQDMTVEDMEFAKVEIAYDTEVVTVDMNSLEFYYDVFGRNNIVIVNRDVKEYLDNDIEYKIDNSTKRDKVANYMQNLDDKNTYILVLEYDDERCSYLKYKDTIYFFKEDGLMSVEKIVMDTSHEFRYIEDFEDEYLDDVEEIGMLYYKINLD